MYIYIAFYDLYDYNHPQIIDRSIAFYHYNHPFLDFSWIRFDDLLPSVHRRLSPGRETKRSQDQRTTIFSLGISIHRMIFWINITMINLSLIVDIHIYIYIHYNHVLAIIYTITYIYIYIYINISMISP